VNHHSVAASLTDSCTLHCMTNIPLHFGWRRGVAITSLGVSTKLLYIGPG